MMTCSNHYFPHDIFGIILGDFIDNFYYLLESLCIIRQNFLGAGNECLLAVDAAPLVDVDVVHLVVLLLHVWLQLQLWKFYLAFGPERVGSRFAYNFDLQYPLQFWS